MPESTPPTVIAVTILHTKIPSSLEVRISLGKNNLRINATLLDESIDSIKALILKKIGIAAIWSENSDFGQNSDQNHGKCLFGQKKVRILDSSQKF